MVACPWQPSSWPLPSSTHIRHHQPKFIELHHPDTGRLVGIRVVLFSTEILVKNHWFTAWIRANWHSQETHPHRTTLYHKNHSSWWQLALSPLSYTLTNNNPPLLFMTSQRLRKNMGKAPILKQQVDRMGGCLCSSRTNWKQNKQWRRLIRS